MKYGALVLGVAVVLWFTAGLVPMLTFAAGYILAIWVGAALESERQ
jgi:hypothetical protein